MSNLKLVTQSYEQSAEELIHQYRELNAMIKTMESKKEELKKTIIEKYLQNEDSLYAQNGTLLATYKANVRTNFKTKEFEKDHLELFNKYAYLSEHKTFLVK